MGGYGRPPVPARSPQEPGFSASAVPFRPEGGGGRLAVWEMSVFCVFLTEMFGERWGVPAVGEGGRCGLPPAAGGGGSGCKSCQQGRVLSPGAKYVTGAWHRTPQAQRWLLTIRQFCPASAAWGGYSWFFSLSFSLLAFSVRIP